MKKTGGAFELIPDPNRLQAKIGGSLPALDAAAIERAEANLKALEGTFADWLAQEVARLEGMLRQYLEAPEAPDRRDALYGAAHDLKGTAATYGYPAIGWAAA